MDNRWLSVNVDALFPFICFQFLWNLSAWSTFSFRTDPNPRFACFCVAFGVRPSSHRHSWHSSREPSSIKFAWNGLLSLIEQNRASKKKQTNKPTEHQIFLTNIFLLLMIPCFTMKLFEGLDRSVKFYSSFAWCNCLVWFFCWRQTLGKLGLIAHWCVLYW